MPVTRLTIPVLSNPITSMSSLVNSLRISH
nr:MAG TPA: hypothetical protein [Bacteriophage sp.]